MCAIVDADMSGRFFNVPIDADLLPLWKWINGGKGVLFVGGRLRTELFGNHRVRDAIQEWARVGHAVFVPNEKVDDETSNITEQCQSNDAHVIALARVSGARLLCSGDQSLHADFDNRELINNPRGKVYQNAGHRNLLRSSASWHRRCPRGVPTRPSRLAAPARGA